MKMFFATLTTILLLASFSGIVTAQIEHETEEQMQQMPMMQGMMGGQAGMMQQGDVTGQMPMMGGMMCPMCGRMMGGGMMQGMMGQMPMMQRMMGGQGGMMGHMPMMHGMMGRMHGMPALQMLLFLSDELGLDEEQVTSIKKIGFDFQKEAIQKNADLSISGVELNALLSQDDIDLEQAQEKIQQIANLEGEMKIAQIRAFIDIKEVLTEEQRAKVKKLMMEKAAKSTKKPTQESKEAGNHPMH